MMRKPCPAHNSYQPQSKYAYANTCLNNCIYCKIYCHFPSDILRTNAVEHTIYAYIACGSASLYAQTLYFFLTVLALSAAATVANIKIRYDAKTPQFAIFGARVICVFYSCDESYVEGEGNRRKVPTLV